MRALARLAEWLTANPWLNLVFLVLAILSVIATVASHVLSRRRKRPCYNQESYRLVGEKATKVPRIRILYDDERIENLTLTKVAIWNDGNDAVEPTDFAPSDRLRLEIAPPAKILAVEIAYNSTAANNFRIVRAGDEETISQIEFDYFHRNEGIVVDLFHTGTDVSVGVRGTVKGMGNLRRRRPKDDPLTDRLLSPIALPVLRALKKLPGPFGSILFFAFALVLTPFFFPLFMIDQAQKMLKPIPKQFSL